VGNEMAVWHTVKFARIWSSAVAFGWSTVPADASFWLRFGRTFWDNHSTAPQNTVCACWRDHIIAYQMFWTAGTIKHFLFHKISQCSLLLLLDFGNYEPNCIIMLRYGVEVEGELECWMQHFYLVEGAIGHSLTMGDLIKILRPRSIRALSVAQFSYWNQCFCRSLMVGNCKQN
jgi:hypothetical protein